MNKSQLLVLCTCTLYSVLNCTQVKVTFTPLLTPGSGVLALWHVWGRVRHMHKFDSSTVRWFDIERVKSQTHQQSGWWLLIGWSRVRFLHSSLFNLFNRFNRFNRFNQYEPTLLYSVPGTNALARTRRAEKRQTTYQG